MSLSDPKPGERRGDITFASLMDEGMSANLYLVWHHRYWAAMVVKMLRARESTDAKWRRLLQREGEALQVLAHPNIVRLHTMDMDAELPYLLLAYLPGQTVRQTLRESGAYTISDALRLISHIGGTLAYVHSRGYLHRDVKPGNILVNCGYPTLFDFGVAWPLSDQLPDDKSGTPMYLAPEQCYQHSLSPATDIWALGIFLFELLTTQRPFPEGAPHRYDAPLPVRYPQLVTPPRTLFACGIDAPPIQAILDRCLQPDPAARYPSVEALLVAIDLLLETKTWPAFALPADRRTLKAFQGIDTA